MTLQHNIEEAHNSGYKAGEARKHRDESCAKFHADWFKRFLLTCDPADRKQIQEAFDSGYSAGRNMGKPHYFR